MANRFTITPANPLQALMIGGQAYESADKRAQEADLRAAMEAAAPDVARGDYQSAMAKLGGRGGLQGLTALANLQTQATAAKRAEAALAESARHNRVVESRPQIVGNAETGFYAIPPAGIAGSAAPVRPGAPPGSGMFPTAAQGGNPPPDRPAGLQPIIPPAPLKAPPGFERMSDGSLRPIPGGPADPDYFGRKEAVKAAEKEKTATSELQLGGRQVLGMVDQLEKKTIDPRFSKSAGAVTGAVSEQPIWSPMRLGYEAIQSRENKAFLDQIKQDAQAINTVMQRALLKGGGQITENERIQINQILGAIASARSPEDAKALLDNFRGVVRKIFQMPENGIAASQAVPSNIPPPPPGYELVK